MPEAPHMEVEGSLAGCKGEQAVSEHIVAECPILVGIGVACHTTPLFTTDCIVRWSRSDRVAFSC